MNLLKLWEIVKDVEEAVGKEKVETLKRNESKPLKRLLELAYSPFIMFYIKKLPQVKTGNRVIDFSELEELCKKLSSREVTGNAAIEEIKSFASGLSEECWELAGKVLQKDLKCGISVASVNKAFPSLIDVFEVMLAEELKISNKKEILKRYNNSTIYVEPKLDGVRMVAFIESSGTTIYSRNGKQILGYEDLEKELFELFPPNTVVDGELMSVEFEARKLELKKLIASGEMDKAEALRGDDGIFQDLIKDVFRKSSKKSGKYYIFDYMTKEEFITGETKILAKRKTLLKKELSSKELKDIFIVPYIPMEINQDTICELEEIYNSMYLQGYEGIMLKTNTKYPKKRSWNLVKMKPSNTIDLEVIGIFEGEKGSKYEGSLGGVTVEFKNNTVDIGSGWTDADRNHYFNNPHLIIGKVIEIEYQRESTNKEGKHSLIFPRVRCIRNDKC